MKKYFLSLVAMAAAMLFATSCQESLVEPQVGGPTTFTVQLPDAMGTKAIGDKENVNQLLVAVYSDANVDPVALTRATATSTSGQFKVQFNLLQDQSYDIVFWAQVENEYVVANNDFELKSITMKNDYHNNENGAAFFAYVADFVPTGSAQSVTLKRPFAQLNLGTTEASLNPATGAVSLVSSEIKIKGLAQQFNTITGMGENPTTEVVTYSDVIPTDWQELSAAGSIYEYVSMDYLPIVGDDKAVFDIEAKIVVKDAAGDEKPINHKFTSVPVQENYRTNIVGNLISSTSDFIVSIDDRFVDENGNLNPDNDYLVVDNVYEAQVAFGKGETHVAINNIGNTQTLQLPDNGKELYLQLPDSDGQITIKRDAGNFNISVPDTNPSNTGLTIIIDAPNSTVGFTGQALVINSTTASNTLNLSGANVGTIIVMQGNVVIENKSQVEVLDNQSDGQVTVYVDNTSDVNVPQDDNFNKVAEPAVVETLADLQTILTYSASDVVELSNAITNTSDFILDLNGKTVTAVDNATGSYGLITNKAKLTIKGQGTISLSATNNRGWNAYSSVISNQPGGNLTVGEGVVIEHLGGTDMAYGIDNLTNGKNTSAIATINDATVKSTYRAVRQFLNGVEANNSLTVNSNAVIEGANKSIWMQDPSAKPNTGTLVVNEGAALYGDVYLFVTAGSTEWPVSVSIAAKAVNDEVLTGNVPEGYEVVCENGVWIVKWSPKSENFAENTWEDIIKACQNNVVPESWNVGDIKTMKIGDYTYDIAIIGKNHDDYTAGGKAPLTFKVAEVCGTAPMNETQTNTTGWSGSAMRNTTMPEILETMPEEVQNAIKAVKKETLNGTRDGLETTSDKLFLLSEIEVNGSVYFSNNFAEGARYAYYTDLNSQIMNASWWLRGPGKNNAIGFTQINGSGNMANGSAETAVGVVFGFCF